MEETKVTPVTPVPQSSPVQPTPVEEKKKGNGLKIVIIVLVVLFLLCALCGGVFYVVGKNQVDQLVNNEKVINDFNTSIVDTDALPLGFPTDQVLFPSDYVVVKAGTNDKGSEWKYSVAYMTSESVSYVKELYTKEMVANGWKLDSSTVITGIDTIILSKANKGLIVTITDASEGGETTTVANVIYQEK